MGRGEILPSDAKLDANKIRFISHSDYDIMIGHFPGDTKIFQEDLIDQLKERTFKVPDNVTILSVNTMDLVKNLSGCLPYQLAKNNINYVNPLAGKDISWNRKDKIDYVIQGLKEVKTEYTLILDGNDVVVLSDLTDIVERYKPYNVDILYNATIWMFPPVVIDFVKHRDRYGTYNYLNAGCCIGKTDKLIEFYEEAWQICLDAKGSTDSEQFYVRKAFDNHQDKVWFDFDCRIFQCWHVPQYEQIDEHTIKLASMKPITEVGKQEYDI